MKRDFEIPAHLAEPKANPNGFDMMDDMGRYCDPRPQQLAAGAFPEQLALAGCEFDSDFAALA